MTPGRVCCPDWPDPTVDEIRGLQRGAPLLHSRAEVYCMTTRKTARGGKKTARRPSKKT